MHAGSCWREISTVIEALFPIIMTIGRVLYATETAKETFIEAAELKQIWNYGSASFLDEILYIYGSTHVAWNRMCKICLCSVQYFQIAVIFEPLDPPAYYCNILQTLGV